jgi:predicted transcriptional regulator of viral defense system
MFLPEALPDTFTYREALTAGVTKHHLYALRAAQAIEPIGRGLYRRATASNLVDLDQLEIARRAPRATLCLATALAYHQLTDANPAAIDVALPAGSRRPAVTAPVAWHLFSRETFDVGRDALPIDAETSIGIYNAQRSIIDAFRLRHREGEDLAYIALRRWLRRPGSSPAVLYDMARQFPRTIKPITRALEILQYD